MSCKFTAVPPASIFSYLNFGDTLTPIFFPYTGDTDVGDIYSGYSPSTAYFLGDRVEDVKDIIEPLLPNRRIWESIADDHTGNYPSDSPNFWLEVGVDNRMRLFDGLNSSKTRLTVGESNKFYKFRIPRPLDTLAVVSCTNVVSVRCRMYKTPGDESSVIYDEQISMRSPPQRSTWYSWLYEPRSLSSSQAIFYDIPGTIKGAEMRVDFNAGNGAECGQIVFGMSRQFGRGVNQGAINRINNFDYRERTEFGDFKFVEIGQAPEADYSFQIDLPEIRSFTDFIASRSSKPTLYIGAAANGFGHLAFVGIPNDLSILNFGHYGEVNLRIEGLKT